MKSAFKAQFRFYEELNDFLPTPKKRKNIEYPFNGSPAIKDAIQAVGVPHTEVDLIIVNGKSVDFHYRLKHGDYVSIYPMFESMDISSITRLRKRPLRESRFILDVHLGKLARRLRLLGFDTLYRNDFDDPEIIDIATDEKRIILTRDLGILKHKKVTHGYWVRSKNPKKQLDEVLNRFDLFTQIKPFYRCMICNHNIHIVDKSNVINKIEPRTALLFDDFYQCSGCNKIYWKGSHYDRMVQDLEQLSPKKILQLS